MNKGIINQSIDQVDPRLLKRHPRNPNQGDLGAILESVKENGFWGTIVANKRTGHVLAGNHRLSAAIEAGLPQVPVAWVDVSDEDEVRILLADNRTTRLGNDDESALAELLADLAQTEAGLTGTGYDGDDLDDIIGRLAGGNTAVAPEDFKAVDENIHTDYMCPKCHYAWSGAQEILEKEMSLSGIQRPLANREIPKNFVEVFRMGDFAGWVAEADNFSPVTALIAGG